MFSSLFIMKLLFFMSSLSTKQSTSNAWITSTTRRSVVSTLSVSPVSILQMTNGERTSELTDTITISQESVDPIFCWNSDDGLCSRLNQLASLKSNLQKAKMIVFDKDGTLGDCSASLKRWALFMTERLTSALIEYGCDNIERDIAIFHAAIGWDVATGDVLPSAPIAAGTWEEQIISMTTLLKSFGLPPHLARDWNKEVADLHSNDEPVIPNLKEMLRQCQELGLRVAVCTSDDRDPTNRALRRWDIDDLVEYSICGNEVTESKPSAAPLLQLCNANSLVPDECIMVGDTTADTGMARNAKALFCIGVLTGSGTPTQLTETGADIIVPHVGHIPALLQAMGRERMLQTQVEPLQEMSATRISIAT